MKLQCNRFLSEFSTFGIGGPIRFFLEVSNPAEMEEAILFAKQEQIPFLIIGKGSNSLFSDRGFDGLVILNKIDSIAWEEDRVVVGSGYSFSLLGVQTARKGWAGLEFASGIPATVGGAIWMNAGANGGSTSDTLDSVLFLSADGEIRTFRKEELSFGYRASPFQKMSGAILEATFVLKADENARASQLKIIDYRMKTQPLKEKSVGCVFRNPEGNSAGALIEQSKLKGVQIGGAKVSEIHANFIVNTGQATASDVQALIRHVQEQVKTNTGIELELEVRVL